MNDQRQDDVRSRHDVEALQISLQEVIGVGHVASEVELHQNEKHDGEDLHNPVQQAKTFVAQGIFPGRVKDVGLEIRAPDEAEQRRDDGQAD